VVPGPVRAPDELYGLPLDEFIAARDALAKELRGAGDKEGAVEVKARRKPSVASWAVNQAARRHRSDVERLLAAGADSREAQEQALAGDAGALRDATRTLNEEVERVAGLAAGELEAAGREVSPAIRDRIITNLRAAAVDDEGGRLLERGVLTEDLEATGFGVFDLAPPPAGGRTPPVRRPPAAKRSKEEDEALATARRELRRAEADAEAATGRARRRAERAEAAERRAIEAHREAQAVRVEAEEGAGEAEAARRRVEEVAARLAELE
jgi:hypothetical protein